MPGELYQVNVILNPAAPEEILVTVSAPVQDDKLYIQETPPVSPPNVYMWMELLPDNKVTMWIEDGL